MIGTVGSDYERDGYYFPIRVMTADRAATHRAELEPLVARYSDDPELRKILLGHAFIVLPMVDEIMRSAAVLDPVKEILGPDLLVLGGSFFIKQPDTPHFVSWHQDLTYWGLDDATEVTAWVALSPATPESGCMQFVPGSHTRNIVEHRDTFDEANMLSRGQELVVDVEGEEIVNVVLQPGEMSLHHGHVFHASGPNRSDDARIGLALRFITPAMRQTSGHRTYARLVAGEDRHGHFHLIDQPSGVMADADIETARASIAAQEEIRYAGAAEKGKRQS